MDIIDIIVLGLLAVLIPILLIAVGAIGAIASAHAGKKYIILVGMITAIIPAFLGAMVGDMAFHFEGNVGMTMGASIAFVITMVVPIFACTQGEHFRKLVREAPEVANIGRRIFARVTSGEEIKLEDLEKALAGDSWSTEERAALQHMKGEIEEVGHVIGTNTSSTVTIMPMGNGTMIMPRTTSTNIYAISRSDLDSYAERRATKWKVWLK